MAWLGAVVGGLIPTLLISRLGLWLTRQWNGGAQRLLAVHGVSLLLVSFVAGIGMADGGAFAGLNALSVYALPQAVWLVVDLIRRQAPQSPPDHEARSPSSRNQILWFSAAVIGMAMVCWGVLWFASSQQPPEPARPWEYSWEAPAEAPADPAAPEYEIIEGGLVDGVAPAEAPADPAAGAFDDLIAPAEAPADPDKTPSSSAP